MKAVHKASNLLALICLSAIFTPVAAADQGWQRIIRPEDRARLLGLWPAWNRSRAQASADGHAAEWNAYGVLTDPAANTTGQWPEPGVYRCTLIKTGSRQPGMPPISAARVIPCEITKDARGLSVIAQGPMQRSAGRLYSDGDRMVFLGATTLRGDMSAFDYGKDSDRNEVGVFEIIGPSRWRLLMPWPHWQSILDIVEITPVDAAPSS